MENKNNNKKIKKNNGLHKIEIQSKNSIIGDEFEKRILIVKKKLKL